MRAENICCITTLWVFIWGCNPITPVAHTGGEEQIGDFRVKWRTVDTYEDRVTEGLTPLVFIFSSNVPQPDNGVTEDDWIKEAARLGMSVEMTKSTIHGGSAYKGPDGNLRTCTISAIQRGLCGRKLGLSIDQRTSMAKTLLDSSDKCQWVGFDARYNALASVQAGAEQFTLHVPAKCI